jgi:hypothetical protein
MQQSPPLHAKGTFVGFVPTVSHMHVMHLVFACLTDCPRCNPYCTAPTGIFVETELSVFRVNVRMLCLV